ncbi:MAG: hypothetical protein AB4063_26155 [Crocosphaera sp.]
MNFLVASTIISTLTTTFKFISSTIAQQEIQNLYLSLKKSLGEKLGLERPLNRWEERPTPERQKLLVEDLTDAVDKFQGTEQQKEEIINEILAKTEVLNQSLANLPPSDFDAIGMDLENVEAANAIIGKVISEGGAKVLGIRVKDSKFTGDLKAGDVKAKKVVNLPESFLKVLHLERSRVEGDITLGNIIFQFEADPKPTESFYIYIVKQTSTGPVVNSYKFSYKDISQKCQYPEFVQLLSQLPNNNCDLANGIIFRLTDEEIFCEESNFNLISEGNKGVIVIPQEVLMEGSDFRKLTLEPDIFQTMHKTYDLIPGSPDDLHIVFLYFKDFIDRYLKGD